MRALVNGNGMNYETYGKKGRPPVVFVHGFPFSRQMWAQQVDALKEGFHVVTYDVRGHGESDVGDGQYSIEYFVDDLMALLEHVHLGSVVVVGLSMGGYIALRAVERHPDRFRGLVLCDTRSEADGNEGKLRRAQQAAAAKSEGMKRFADGFIKAVFYEQTFRTNPAAVEEIRSIIEQTSPLAVAGTLIALAARTDTTTSLSNIRIPTLILVGERDALTPPAASLAMKERIPGAALHVIPDAGHLSNLENPGEFNRHLLTFVNSLQP